jgi:hypothetical protein
MLVAFLLFQVLWFEPNTVQIPPGPPLTILAITNFGSAALFSFALCLSLLPFLFSFVFGLVCDFFVFGFVFCFAFYFRSLL